MPLILSCRDLTKSYGGPALFQNISLGISANDQIGMIGPNGAGKSTFLKILAGMETPDHGDVAVSRGACICYLSQEDVFPDGKTVHAILLDRMADAPGEDYEKEIEVDRLLEVMGFDNPLLTTAVLSGGWRKRLAIACQIIRKPNLLLMDEPTNHLDLQGILWLEKYLLSAPFAFLAVSHDRYFLQAVSSRVIEINRRYPEGHFASVGSYGDFLMARGEYFARQVKNQDVLANKVRREIEWLSRGPKARTTKAEARITEAHRMIGDLGELKSRNALTKSVQIDFTSADRQSKKLVAVENLAKAFEEKILLRNLHLTLSPGMRLGLMGANGCGKTTLLKILKGDIYPDSGKIERTERLRTVFFDQQREQIDESQTLKSALTPYGDQVVYRDEAMHIVTWARKFLFQSEQLNMTVAKLSGGERARILIARLMQQPADLLILDEPTNDLDIPTLEVLEESLMDFPGALVLVTHDRYMLDRVSTHLLALDGKGGATFFADYAQWEAEQRQQNSGRAVAPEKQAGNAEKPASKPEKLGRKEQLEYAGMENRITTAENRVSELQNEMASAEVIANAERLQDVCARLHDAQTAVEKLYARWAELEGKRG